MYAETFWCIIVAVIWGGTNPLMKKGSAGIEKAPADVTSANKTQKEESFIHRSLVELKFLIFNWKYTLPFLVNQSGSILYYWTLSSATLSVAVPLTNALTLIVTVLVGKVLGERSGGFLLYIGIGLVFAGVAITNY